MTNERKLMPYEHQLIEALGITKEDYLDFVAQQHVYEDIKEGTIFDARNDFGVTAIILTIVGTILQVVAALLARPEEESGQKRTRDDIFAPRSGFNSTQQLATYGDPVNLIYTNKQVNGQGGVRVNTALIWSAMKSFGSSQYIQMLFVLGAGGVGQIDYSRTAFGQTPIRDLTSQNYWLYFQNNGTGAIRKNQLRAGGQGQTDPGAFGSGGDNVYRVFARGSASAMTDGFSHAISPATSSNFGAYAPVPINVLIEVRNERGEHLRALNQIRVWDLARWGNNNPGSAGEWISQGEGMRVTVERTYKEYGDIASEEAAESRRVISSAFDNAGVMKLGAAKFSVVRINTGSTEQEDMAIDLVCTQSGAAPSCPYSVIIQNFYDNVFYIKALVKVEVAKYETLSPCHMVDFAIKGQVWRRISGRQSTYGSGRFSAPFRDSDNGIKKRSAMFLVKYKKAKSTGGFTFVPGIFVVSRAAEVDNFVYFRFDSGLQGLSTAEHWQFEIEPVHDSLAEFRTHPLARQGILFFYLENSGSIRRIDLPGNAGIFFTGNVRGSGNYFPPDNTGPRFTNQYDLFSQSSDAQYQMSFDGGPEFTITAVTEQIRESATNFPGLYQDISLLGFNMYSGRNVQDLRSLTAFVELGRRSRLLRTSGTINGIQWGQPGYQYLSPSPNGYANTAPDIFIDTALDANDGIGKYAGDLFSIDLEQLARSKKFCERNRLFMDGIVAEATSWRQFWAEKAGFSLLELAKQDGKESLVPAVPYNRGNGTISRTIQISALFNPGNILEDSYKEEFVDYGINTEDVITTVIYRDNEREGAFPRKNSVDVALNGVNESNAFRETVDASAFVTRRAQAILIGKYLCQIRRHSRRSIEFKTFPTDSFVAPGSYIYVEFAQNQWNRIQTGTIGEGGKLNLPFGEAIRNGSYQMLLYNPVMIENRTVYRQAEPIVNGASVGLRGFKDHVFVLGQVRQNKRVFRVTEVSMDEEGEVTIKGVEHGTDADGLSLISRGLGEFVSGLFLIDGKREQQ